MPPIPRRPKIEYNKTKSGYIGELGSGAHTRIKFLQTAVRVQDLDSISLIETIPGSEKWNVQDLFQRDVDQNRVEESILPYLQDDTQVKFFNPLTLVLLPLRTNGDVDTSVPYIAEQEIETPDGKFTVFERKGWLKYSIMTDQPAYSAIEWNDEKVKLVAIDGQHRLSALKLWSKVKGSKALDGWDIPVVILSVFRADQSEGHEPPTLLEVVRRTFVHINSRAETVNEARRILLDDEEIESVCTQELVQASHENDCKEPTSSVKASKLPLMMFDWRGQVKWKEEGSREDGVPGSLLSVTEVYQWMKNYVFGEGRDAEVALGLDELDPPLSQRFRETNKLDHTDSSRVRQQFNKTIAPGLSHLLENFSPFKTYISEVRKYEQACLKKSESYRFAFERLRFGRHADIGETAKSNADKAFDEVAGRLTELRDGTFPGLVGHDIGMRAILYAFAELKTYRDKCEKKTNSWKDHAEWFVPKLNKVNGDGWFQQFNKLDKDHRNNLIHVCFDPAGNIVNYKVNEVPKALGALLALLVANQGITDFKTAKIREELWEIFEPGLTSTLAKGFRKHIRSTEGANFKGTPEQVATKVRAKAEKKVAERLKSFRKLISLK
jgi:hypothetical protein